MITTKQPAIGDAICDMHYGQLRPMRLPDTCTGWTIVSSIYLATTDEIDAGRFIESMIRLHPFSLRQHHSYLNKMLNIINIVNGNEVVAACSYDSRHFLLAVLTNQPVMGCCVCGTPLHNSDEPVFEELKPHVINPGHREQVNNPLHIGN